VGVKGLPGNTVSFISPTDCAALPFASGVPTVRWSERCAGALH
jgi:hypothetical protein